MNFEPVATKEDLDTLDHDEIVEGYRTAECGDPEPGPNRGRAVWHGWRMRMMDLKQLEIDEPTRALVKALFPRTYASMEEAHQRGKGRSPWDQLSLSGKAKR